MEFPVGKSPEERTASGLTHACAQCAPQRPQRACGLLHSLSLLVSCFPAAILPSEIHLARLFTCPPWGNAYPCPCPLHKHGVRGAVGGGFVALAVGSWLSHFTSLSPSFTPVCAANPVAQMANLGRCFAPIPRNFLDYSSSMGLGGHPDFLILLDEKGFGLQVSVGIRSELVIFLV